MPGDGTASEEVHIGCFSLRAYLLEGSPQQNGHGAELVSI